MNPTLARLLARLGLLARDRVRIVVPAHRVRIEAGLIVECADGDRRPYPFVIDSGCSTTTMDLARARSFGLLTSGRRTTKSKTGSAGSRTITAVEGRLRLWLSPRQRAAPFVVPIDFEDGRPAGVPALFGLKGVIDQMRWAIGPSRPRAEGVLGQCVLSDARRAADRFPA